MEFKAPTYYDDIYEALDLQVLRGGKPKKELAATLYPGRQIETAKSLFSRALSPENTDVHLSIEKLIALMDQIGAEHVINFLCDRYFFQRPKKRAVQAIALDKKYQFENLLNQVDAIESEIRKLARKER